MASTAWCRGSGTSLRGRGRYRPRVPWGAIIAAELFFQLRDAYRGAAVSHGSRPGSRPGWDLEAAHARARLEPSYILQFVNAPTPLPNRREHVIQLQVVIASEAERFRVPCSRFQVGFRFQVRLRSGFKAWFLRPAAGWEPSLDASKRNRTWDLNAHLEPANRTWNWNRPGTWNLEPGTALRQHHRHDRRRIDASENKHE